MTARRVIVGIVAGALGAAAALVAPAFGATERDAGHMPRRQVVRNLGGFTPAAGDPRLAAVFARGGFDTTGFRFTPAETRRGAGAVTVAVRARTNRDAAQVATAAPASTIGLAPIAYNLGAAVGWKRFAIAGDVARIDLAGAPGSREAADVALSYTAPHWSGRVKAAADRPIDGTPRAIAELPSYSVDLGGSYALTNRLDLTAGVRYRTDRDRLTRVDDRRDSQAVYLGTAFRF